MRPPSLPVTTLARILRSIRGLINEFGHRRGHRSGAGSASKKYPPISTSRAVWTRFPELSIQAHRQVQAGMLNSNPHEKSTARHPQPCRPPHVPEKCYAPVLEMRASPPLTWPKHLPPRLLCLNLIFPQTLAVIPETTRMDLIRYKNGRKRPQVASSIKLH